MMLRFNTSNWNDEKSISILEKFLFELNHFLDFYNFYNFYHKNHDFLKFMKIYSHSVEEPSHRKVIGFILGNTCPTFSHF